MNKLKLTLDTLTSVETVVLVNVFVYFLKYNSMVSTETTVPHVRWENPEACKYEKRQNMNTSKNPTERPEGTN